MSEVMIRPRTSKEILPITLRILRGCLGNYDECMNEKILEVRVFDIEYFEVVFG